VREVVDARHHLEVDLLDSEFRQKRNCLSCTSFDARGESDSFRPRIVKPGTCGDDTIPLPAARLNHGWPGYRNHSESYWSVPANRQIAGYIGPRVDLKSLIDRCGFRLAGNFGLGLDCFGFSVIKTCLVSLSKSGWLSLGLPT